MANEGILPILGIDDLPFLDVGRYENVPLYLDADKDGNIIGKIGLVDLETFKSLKSSPDLLFIAQACIKAVALFPHHLELIINEAKKFHYDVDLYKKQIEDQAKYTLNYFKMVHYDHSEFLMRKDITIENPSHLIQIDEKRMAELKTIIGGKIIEMDRGSYPILKNCLGEDKERALGIFKDNLPIILETMFNLFSKGMKKKMGNKTISTKTELIKMRTIRHETTRLAELCVRPFIENFKEPDLVANYLFDEILSQLVSGDEIASYFSGFGYGETLIFL